MTRRVIFFPSRGSRMGQNFDMSENKLSGQKSMVFPGKRSQTTVYGKKTCQNVVPDFVWYLMIRRVK